MLTIFEKENERLKKLYSLNILDTEPENEYDRITSLASRRFNVPISLVSLIDKDRQWFKSRCGIDILQTSREASFCSEMITRNKPCVVYDTLTDDRFRRIATHPIYLRPLRFYVGIPLTTKDGYNLGSLCIADYNPNHGFSEEDKNDLYVMAEMIMSLIEATGSRQTH